MENNYYILIGCDCDPDRMRFNTKISSEQFVWDGFLSISNFFNNVRFIVEKKYGLNIVITYYIRADNQMFEEYGMFDYCFKLFDDKIRKNVSELDEIGWHHHHFIKQNNKYSSVWSDKKWMADHVYRSFDAIKRFDVKTVHCGELIINSATMNAYSEIGIENETTVAPGLGNIIGEYNRYDFLERSSNAVYYPSKDNFLLDSESNNILVIPTNTVYSRFLNCVDKVNYAIRTKSLKDGNVNKKTFIPINASPLLFRPFFDKILKEDKVFHFNTYFHADEILPDKYKNFETKLIFAQENLLTNICYVIDKLQEIKKNIVFTNFKSFNSIYNENSSLKSTKCIK